MAMERRKEALTPCPVNRRGSWEPAVRRASSFMTSAIRKKTPPSPVTGIGGAAGGPGLTTTALAVRAAACAQPSVLLSAHQQHQVPPSLDAEPPPPLATTALGVPSHGDEEPVISIPSLAEGLAAGFRRPRGSDSAACIPQNRRSTWCAAARRTEKLAAHFFCSSLNQLLVCRRSASLILYPAGSLD